MGEVLREGVVDALRYGVPTVAAIAGARYGTRKQDTLKHAVLGAGVGFLAGWAVQKALLWGLEALSYPQMPTKSAAATAPAAEPEMPVMNYPAAETGAPEPTTSSMSGMYAPTTAPQSTQRGEKGGGDGVTTAQVPSQTGREPRVNVTGTLFKGAYGGMGN